MKDSNEDKIVSTRRPLTDAEVNAAAKVIYAAGQHHGWSGFKGKSFESLDPIGRDEFLAIVERALDAAVAARGEPSEKVNPVDLSAQVNSVRTKEDLVIFLDALSSAYRKDQNSWENNNLRAFLDALTAWTNDMDGYYRNQGMPIPKEPTWKIFADMLWAATMYE